MSSDGKKDMSQPLAPAYDPKAVEADWYDWWVKQGYFTADPKSEKPKYVIVIPPPNVTGALHIGHALTAAVEDSIIRWRRMNGYNTLWLPGTDHAGIATQVVVEKRLKREQNISRHDLGRERFVEEVWKWKNQYGNRILNQLRRTGCSVDWTREHFTLDDQLSRAVQVSFIQLFNEGLIYRAKRLVNWSCALKSAISDLEVEYITLDKPTRLRVPGHEKTIEFGFLTEFAYKVDGSDEEIVVATTRLETMLGDTAVAVHPDDARYKHLHGKLLVHPFVHRKIPIITDAELVDMSFGTGAVKVTPAHDPNDYQTGLRHKLAEITVFTTDGRINENGGEFQGMMRFDARVAMEKRMEELKILREKKPNPGQRLGQCSRSGDIIEPLLKPQWWMNCKPMAEESIKAARDGRLEILPEIHRDTWFRWLENIRDWCISRQLWWGHRIPAYYVVFAGEPEIIPDEEDISRWVTGGSLDFVTALAKAKFPDREFKLLQDEDVLDTWYSSGLFPFSTMGWPDLEHPDFKAFFPTSLLETGHDILFFWVARMVMMSIKLTGQIPFKQVYLHAMVRDAHGRKMSKALGNVIDPLDVIEGISLENLHTKLKDGNLDPREVEKAIAGQKKDYPEGIPECGTDALRFALCAYTSQGRDINLDVNRVVGYRQFCNKIWNATKFLMLYVGTNFTPLPIEQVAKLALTSGDKWILSRLNACAATCQSSMEKFEFADVTQSAYSFWLYEFCDVYVELSKPTLQADETPDNADRKRTVKNVLYTCLETGLRILAPFMPFVTEELWQRLPRRPDYSVPSICIAAYPTPIEGWTDSDVEERMKLVLAAVSTARSMRVAYGLHPAARPTFYISSKSQSTLQAYQAQADDVKTLAQAGTVEVLPQGADAPAGCGIRPINDQADLSLVLKGVVDFDNEIKSLNKKKAVLEKAMEQLQKKMEIPGYEQKVPENIREQNSSKLQSQKSEMDTIIKAIENFTMLRDS